MMKALLANIVDVTFRHCFRHRVTTAPLVFIRYTLTSTLATVPTLAVDYWYPLELLKAAKKAPLSITTATRAVLTTTTKPLQMTTSTRLWNCRATHCSIFTAHLLTTTNKKKKTAIQRFLFLFDIFRKQKRKHYDYQLKYVLMAQFQACSQSCTHLIRF